MSNTILKAVILARGLGTRMRRTDASAAMTGDQARAADSGVKGMIPTGRPFMDYLLSSLADAGFTSACLVTGPEHDAVRKYYDRLAPQRIRVVHTTQIEPRGTADAVTAAESFAGSDDFLVINSDNFYPPAALGSARLLEGPGLIAFSARAMIELGGIPRERVAGFPRVETDSEGNLARLAACADPGEGYASMNCWRFGASIFPACRHVAPSSRGELELPDAVTYSITRLGQRYRVLFSEEPVLDLSSRGDIARVTHQLEGVTVNL